MVWERLKPYFLCTLVSIFQAAFNIISKLSLDKGMSRYVLVSYGYAIGTVTTSVLVLLFERKNESKLNRRISLNIFFLALLAVLARILFFAGLENTSVAFSAAMINLIPSMTFLLAIFFRMEKLDIFKINGQAKIIGTVIALGGATLMTLYKGITVISFHNHNTKKHSAASKVSSDKNMIKGSIFLVLYSLTVAALYILETSTIKKYPAPLALTSLIGVAATILATIVAAILDHKASSWKLSWDITLVAPLYNGIVVFGISVFVQVLVLQRRGPVFLTAFRPLATVIAAIMGLLILGEALHFGGMMGAVLIIIGLYAVIWGKEDEKEKKKKQLMTPVNCDQKIEIKADRQ